VFKDRRDTDDPAELQQAIDEELAERAERAGLSISPVDTEGLRFGVDYDLGDRVTVMVDGTPVRDLLREVKFTLTGEGETVTPTVGTPSHPGAALGIFEQLRRLRSRVSGLERS
jgi:prophage tail gpP-like protein